MIRMQVSAVFQVRDGFSGRIIEGSNLRCQLDGIPVRLQSRPGGYLIAVNLPAGSHQLLLQCAGFQDEYVDFSTDTGFHEYYVALKPGRQYLFRQSVTRLRLQLASAMQNAQLWISAPGYAECKIAQTKAEAGSKQFRVYCKGNPSALPIPGSFLIDDGENSEIVVLQSLSEEVGTVEVPLRTDHGRSKRLLPVQLYRSDEKAEVYAAFARAGTAVIYTGSGEPFCRELTEGDNRWEFGE